MNNATFAILGQPVAFEKAVRRIAAPHFTAPLNGPVKVTVNGPVKVTVWATFQPPKSWTKKKTAANINTPHIQCPDLDNLAKAIFGAQWLGL